VSHVPFPLKCIPRVRQLTAGGDAPILIPQDDHHDSAHFVWLSVTGRHFRGTRSDFRATTNSVPDESHRRRRFRRIIIVPADEMRADDVLISIIHPPASICLSLQIVPCLFRMNHPAVDMHTPSQETGVDGGGREIRINSSGVSDNLSVINNSKPIPSI
jgi:hypothetical protein